MEEAKVSIKDGLEMVVETSNRTERFAKSFVISTGFLTATNPLMAELETRFMHLPEDISLHSRLLATGLIYAGLGNYLDGWRFKSRAYFKITEDHSKLLKMVHDTGFTIAACAVISPIQYLLSGSADLRQLETATGWAALSGAAIGFAAWPVVDLFKGLFEVAPSKIVPAYLLKKPKPIKQALGYALAATSMYLLCQIYTNHVNQISLDSKPGIERTVQAKP